MVCQGGGSMIAEFNRKVRWDKPDLFTTRIDFSKSGKAAGEQRPAAGQCAWLDRPVSGEEPSVLVFERTKKNPINNLKVGMHTMRLISAAKEEMEIIQAVYDGRQFIIQVVFGLFSLMKLGFHIILFHAYPQLHGKLTQLL